MIASDNGEVLLRVSARTDVGRLRRGNEDCFLVADLSRGNVGLTPEVSSHRLGSQGSLLVVSDGMGGAVAGEIASDLAVNGVREEMVRAVHITDMPERLRHAVEATNRVVWQQAQHNPHLSGMGATLTAVLCHEKTAYIAQVGDSRAYLIREGRIKQLTKDQSLVQLLVDSGAIRPDQANQVPNNVILQALGTRAEVVVVMTSIDLCVGDCLLLCSDGLSNKVTPEEMRDAVWSHDNDLTDACLRLIDLANQRGGEDNITTLIARFDGTSLQSATQRTITSSLHEITSTDLKRIGGPQLDVFYEPASDAPVKPPNVGAMLEDLGVAFAPSHPGASDGEEPITQVGIPILSREAPDVVVPEAYVQPAQHAPAAHAPERAAPSPAKSGGSGKLILAFVLLCVGVALLGGLALLLYWWFVMRPAG